MSKDGLRIDWETVEDLLIESCESEIPKPKPQPRRSSRTAKIELLVRELTLHLRSAADLAHASGELLPRPTQQELARRTGISKSDVSRCIKDPSANQLRLLWQTADDPDAVLRLPRKQLR
ncbi:MarR family transcriptional regulator [Crateriforma spongiae]|uniref:MarR family transcriptional regulator n=1 Tax=Crateriforma spongiae TaxID=2724528 RepID=UPI00144664DC|nr:MarR family transcriptional regulator [Crateriforma spongiae]